MSFVSLPFLVLFALVLVLYDRLERRGQNLLLLAAGAVFYGWVHPWFLGLLWGSATLDYVCARRIEADPRRAPAWLTLSVVANLSVLGVFKYADFFVAEVTQLLTWLGVSWNPGSLSLLLPLGISFYTFQSMAYTIDVWRGRTHARASYVDVVVFITFFPQLVAGPIERAEHLLTQVERARAPTAEQRLEGASLALWGAVKKICVADVVAPWVDTAFAAPEPSALWIFAASVGFSVQILADFSGYTDIARGVARMLGFELSVNFRQPYRATGPRDLWRRWHITLSQWFRDYVYLPLGGSRHGPVRTTFALAATFLLSGLWHGAAWHFVVWGAYHGAMVWLSRRVEHAGVRTDAWPRAPRVLGMAGLTLFGWFLFRAPSMADVVRHLQAPWTPGPGEAYGVGVLALASVYALALAWVAARVRVWWGSRPDRDAVARVAGGAWLGLASLLVWVGSATAPRPFVYFYF